MKILVTGGLGLIGHNVVQRLEAKEHEVIITDTRTNYGIIPQAEIDYLMAERLKKISGNNIYHIDITDADNFDWPLELTPFAKCLARYHPTTTHLLRLQCSFTYLNFLIPCSSPNLNFLLTV